MPGGQRSVILGAGNIRQHPFLFDGDNSDMTVAKILLAARKDLGAR